MPDIIKTSKSFVKPLFLGLCLILILALIACGGNQVGDNGGIPDNDGNDIIDDNQGEAIDQVSDTVIDMIRQVIEVEIFWADNIYFAEDEPDNPQYEDVRIDKISYEGHTFFEETVAAVFLVELDIFYEEGSWGDYIPFYIVIERTAGNDGWLAVLGVSYDTTENKSAETIILEVVYDLWDIEASVIFDGFSEYIGLGTSQFTLDEDHETEFHFDYEPVYNDGDYWLSYYFVGMDVLSYYNADEARSRIMRLDIDRADCQTYRGIRIGASKDQVLAAYPEVHQEPFWGDEDHLWYNSSDYGMGVGMNLIFWFEDDLLARIELINMFN